MDKTILQKEFGDYKVIDEGKGSECDYIFIENKEWKIFYIETHWQHAWMGFSKDLKYTEEKRNRYIRCLLREICDIIREKEGVKSG